MLVAVLALASCGSGEQANDSGKIKVTTTTGMVGDLARAVGGDYVEVTHLMGPGVDPHLYKASEGDIRRLEKADIIFYNGLNLEGKMGDIMVKMARTGKPTYPVTEAVDSEQLREPPEFLGHYDPHIWFDVSMWEQTLPAVIQGLSTLRPELNEEFAANAAAYREQLTQLHEYVGARIAEIPRQQRVLVTAHDAFGYFGRAYDIEVVGLQGISTSSEYGLKDVKRIVAVITERNLPAVFVESSVPKRSIEAVVEGCKSRGHDVAIGGQLFSDAMGEPGTPQGNYLGMVRYNVDLIVSSLQWEGASNE